MMAQARRSGFGLSVMDRFFAATALAHALVLATCNTKDFAPLGMPIFNPCTDEGADMTLPARLPDAVRLETVLAGLHAASAGAELVPALARPRRPRPVALGGSGLRA
jgi:hypothetical protein